MSYDLGDVVALGIELRDGDGTLADATSVAVTFTLPDGTTATGSVLHPSTGSYTVDWTPTLAGRHTVRWVATGDNAAAFTDTFDVRDTADVPVVSLAEAKRHLNITSTTSDDELRRFLDVATDLCENYAARSFRRRTVTAETHDGGSESVLLDWTPVISVTSVTDDGTAVSDYTLNAESGVLWRDELAGTSWSTGRRVVSVTYVAGYASPPADVQQAVLETLRHLWTTQRGSMSARNPLAGDDYAAGTGWSLPRRVVELLEPHRMVGVA